MMLCEFKDKNESFGKKGEVLRTLYKLLKDKSNVYVPETLIIPLSFFQDSVKEKLCNGETNVLTADQIQELIKVIREKFKNKKIVVRSSASCEDSILFTNSGQYDSFLNLTTDEEIISAINKIFCSFVSSNALEYYKINNIDMHDNGMAVLIQEVAPVKQAGVMFTANPIDGQKNPIIEFCNGLGEDVVSGQKKVTTIKDDYYNISDVLKELMNIGFEIERTMGRPQDIEWGIDDKNNIYIFQARPIVINQRNNKKIRDINKPDNSFVGQPISLGFTLGKLKELNENAKSNILLQTGEITSKDLTTIINSNAVLLKTGGYLSHFANIIREFNKPSMILDENQEVNLDEIYVIDSYNGVGYKLNDLNENEQKTAYWNFFVDLVSNGNKTYLNTIGIKNYKFLIKLNNKESQQSNFEVIKNKIFVDCDNELLEIEFTSEYLLNELVGKITRGEKDNAKVYRCL